MPPFPPIEKIATMLGKKSLHPRYVPYLVHLSSQCNAPTNHVNGITEKIPLSILLKNFFQMFHVKHCSRLVFQILKNVNIFLICMIQGFFKIGHLG